MDLTDDEKAALEAYVDGAIDGDIPEGMVRADEINWGSGTESSAGKARRLRLARERDALTLQRVKERAARLMRVRG